MKNQFLILSTSITILLFPYAGMADVDVLKNSKWREVPGTRSTNQSYGDDYAQVDINSILKNGDVTTYDLIESNGNYARIEENCKTKKSRAIRYGYFETKNRVSFQDRRTVREWQPLEWSTPTNSYQRSIQTFVCRLSSDIPSKKNP